MISVDNSLPTPNQPDPEESGAGCEKRVAWLRV